MKAVIFALLAILAGCSAGPAPVFEGDERDKGSVFQAMEKHLGKNEIIQTVSIDENPGRKLERPMYIVRASTLDEMRGGRQFRAVYENSQWNVVEDESRWFSFDPHGRFGCVMVDAPIDLAIAGAVLEYIRPQLEGGEHVNGIVECFDATFMIDADGRTTGLEKNEILGCVEVVIRRNGPYGGGRVLGVDIQGEEFEIVRSGTVMH